MNVNKMHMNGESEYRVYQRFRFIHWHEICELRNICKLCAINYIFWCWVTPSFYLMFYVFWLCKIIPFYLTDRLDRDRQRNIMEIKTYLSIFFIDTVLFWNAEKLSSMHLFCNYKFYYAIQILLFSWFWFLVLNSV